MRPALLKTFALLAALLLIQGLGADSRGWALQRIALGRRYRCIAVDNRGVGGSTNAPHPFDLEQMARDAISVLDAEDVELSEVGGEAIETVLTHAPGNGDPPFAHDELGLHDVLSPVAAALRNVTGQEEIGE